MVSLRGEVRSYHFTLLKMTDAGKRRKRGRPAASGLSRKSALRSKTAKCLFAVDGLPSVNLSHAAGDLLVDFLAGILAVNNQAAALYDNIPVKMRNIAVLTNLGRAEPLGIESYGIGGWTDGGRAASNRSPVRVFMWGSLQLTVLYSISASTPCEVPSSNSARIALPFPWRASAARSNSMVSSTPHYHNEVCCTGQTTGIQTARPGLRRCNSVRLREPTPSRSWLRSEPRASASGFTGSTESRGRGTSGGTRGKGVAVSPSLRILRLRSRISENTLSRSAPSGMAEATSNAVFGSMTHS